MDYVIPSNFYEFGLGWYQGIDFRNEANLLLDVINQSKKENDIQNYIKEKKNGLFLRQYLKIMTLDIMRLILCQNRNLGKNIALIICCLDEIQLAIRLYW